MRHVNKLVLGGGISAIAWAHFYTKNDYLIIEKSDRLGGLCKSFKVGDSTFDYSGHFVHFNDKELEPYIRGLVTKHKTGEFREYKRSAGIAMTGDDGRVSKIVDYPFQANINQLSYNDFIRCLTDLYDVCKSTKPDSYVSFADLVKYSFGDAITELFFRPYNEKLYRTTLEELSSDGMKRFIPKVKFDEVMENFKTQKEFGYNSTFLYSPESGIQGLVDAFLAEKSVNCSLNEEILEIDLASKTVKTSNTTYTYGTLINTLPLNLFVKLSGETGSKTYSFSPVPGKLKSVDVHVYNITYHGKSSNFDKAYCWLYVPDKDTSFYRVGFYNYMSGKEDTSVYVEVSSVTGFSNEMYTTDNLIDAISNELKNRGFIYDDAKIKDCQRLLMSPAYVILERDTEDKVSKYRAILEECGVYMTGRYGLWTYCSIEDNIKWAKELATKISIL